MLFKKIKKIPEPESIKVPEPVEEVIIEKNTELITESPIKDENDKTEFTTIDVNLVYSLQDKFNVKSVFYDKKNEGKKTFVFYATKGEVEKYLKEEKC